MNKFDAINYSIPLNERLVKYETLEDMKRLLKTERTVEIIEMNDFYSYRWNPNTKSYILYIQERKDDVLKDVSIECPRYAFRQFTSDILMIHDLNKLAISCFEVDQTLDKKWDAAHENRIPSTEISDKLNDVLYILFQKKRVENSRTRPVMVHQVWDFATAAEGGDGRCIVTSSYVYDDSYERFVSALEQAKEINPELEFIKGQSSALRDEITIASKNPVLANEKPTLVGITLKNSMFKYSALHLCSSIFIPEYNIELLGETAKFRAVIPHVGKDYAGVVKASMREVIGKGELLLELLRNLSTCKNRAQAIDFEAHNEKGSNALGVQLGMSKKMNELISIQKEKGYPENVAGVCYTLMDYRTNYAKTDSERDNVNAKVLLILSQPDKFVDDLVDTTVSRAAAIDLSENSTQKSMSDFFSSEKNDIEL